MGLFGKKKKNAAKAAPTAGDGTEMETGTSTPVGFQANPFATPQFSRATTQEKGEFTGYFPPVQTRSYAARRRKFQSSRLQPGEYDEKPWMLGKEDPNFKRKRAERIIFWSCIAAGVVIGAAICALSYMNVSTGTVSHLMPSAIVGLLLTPDSSAHSSRTTSTPLTRTHGATRSSVVALAQAHSSGLPTTPRTPTQTPKDCTSCQL